MTEQKILIRGLETNYKIIGDEKTSLPTTRQVLILHGWGGSSDSWVKIQKILAAQNYKVISPDFPGFGKSKTPAKPWDLDDYTKWLVDFIKFLKLKKISIIAHSFGGRVVVKFAAGYPKKINKLILCSPAGIKIKPDFKWRTALYFNSVGDAVFSLKPLKVFKNAARNLFYVFLRRTDYVKAKGVMRETMKKVLREDLSPCFSKINAETLIIWGKKDKMIPVKYSSAFKNNIEGSKLEILPRVGHSPHLENPEKLLEIITNFLRPR